jgi:acetyl-CoA carboxylase/biotin carboxylase 1
MKAKGVIKDAVPWAESRTYFFYLAKRRIAQDNYVSQLRAADSSLDSNGALDILKGMCSANWEDNAAVLDYYTAKMLISRPRLVK